MNASDEPRRKNPKRRNAKRRANYALDKLQEIENQEAALEGRPPRDLINEYYERKAREQNTIDAEVVSEESSDLSSEGEGDDRPIHLPAVIPKIHVTEPNSNQQEPPRKFSEQWWNEQTYQTQLNRCRAGKADGTRCTRYAVKGSRVCVNHGAGSPAVKQAAKTRLEMATDLVAQRLLGFALTADVKDVVALRAMESVLDRAGIKSPDTVVLSPGEPQTGFEEVFEGLSSIRLSDPVDAQTDSASLAQQGEPETYGAEPANGGRPTTGPAAGDREYADSPPAARERGEHRSRRQSHRERPQSWAEGHTDAEVFGMVNAENAMTPDPPPPRRLRALPPGRMEY